MPTYLARSISLAKWSGRENIMPDALPADGVTNDLKTTDNVLSFWICDPSDQASLQEVAVALAATRDNVQRLDIVWLEECRVAKMGVTISPISGETPAKSLNDNHRNVVGIDLLRLVRLTRGIGRAVSQQQIKRFTAKDIKQLLSEAIKKGVISSNDLKAGISAKL